MRQEYILKISGVLSAVIMVSCLLYKSASIVSGNFDKISIFAAKSVFYMSGEHFEASKNGFYIENGGIDKTTTSSSAQNDEEASSEATSSSPEATSSDESSINEASGVRPNSAEMVLAGGTNYGGLSIKSDSGVASVDFQDELAKALDIHVKTDGTPTVLLYHTHTTECYASDNDDLTRSTDTSRSVVAVGNAVASVLQSYGIGVIHDTTIYDTTYTGSYDRSEAAVRKTLSENPDIDITIDIHRDSLTTANGEKIKPTAIVNGKKAAQIMIISGCDTDGSLNFPDWEYNLRFALKLQKNLSDISANLPRPLYFCNDVYNMNITHASLIAEVGTDANYPEEAVYSGQLLGEALAYQIQKTAGN